MYCPGWSKDQEMPLEGETWGVEVDPPPRDLSDTQTRVHPTPSSLGQHRHVSLAHCDIDGVFTTSPGIGVLGSNATLAGIGGMTLDRSLPSRPPM